MNGYQLKSPKQLVRTEIESLFYSIASARVFFCEHMHERLSSNSVKEGLAKDSLLLDAARHLIYCSFEDLESPPVERICPVVPGIELEVQAGLRDADSACTDSIVLRGLVKTCHYLNSSANQAAQLAASCGYQDAYDLCCEAATLIEELLDKSEELLFEQVYLSDLDDELQLAQ